MPGLFGINILGTVLVIGGILLVSGIKILREYERGVIFRLGRMVLRQIDVLQLHKNHLDPPRIGLGIENLLDSAVDPLPLGQKLV